MRLLHLRLRGMVFLRVVGRGHGGGRVGGIDGEIAHETIVRHGIGVHANKMLFLSRSGGGARWKRLMLVVGRSVLPLEIGELHSKLEEMREVFLPGGGHLRPGEGGILFHDWFRLIYFCFWVVFFFPSEMEGGRAGKISGVLVKERRKDERSTRRITIHDDGLGDEEMKEEKRSGEKRGGGYGRKERDRVVGRGRWMGV